MHAVAVEEDGAAHAIPGVKTRGEVDKLLSRDVHCVYGRV